MNKVKILLSEEPKMECECPFCTSAGCVLTAYDSSYGEKKFVGYQRMLWNGSRCNWICYEIRFLKMSILCRIK